MREREFEVGEGVLGVLGIFFALFGNYIDKFLSSDIIQCVYTVYILNIVRDTYIVGYIFNMMYYL
jgi:hypothetical protein